MSIIGRQNIGLNVVALEVDHDPAVVSTDAPAGSLIFDSSGNITRKKTSGDNTDVIQILGGFTQGSILFTDSSGDQIQDNANLFWDAVNKRLGLGTPGPNAPLDLRGDSPGNVGGFASGALQITSPSVLVNANAVITGHNLFGGNKQLWYLGSASSSNDDVTLINRQNAALSIGTNSITRLKIESDGTFIINESTAIGTGAPAASALLELSSTTKGFLPPRGTTAQIDAISSPAIGLLVIDTVKELLRLNKTSGWCHIPCGVVTGQFSHSVSQKPGVNTPVSLRFNTEDIALEGLAHSTTVKPEEFKATVKKPFTWLLGAQWERTTGGGQKNIDFFAQVSTDGGTVFVDVVNSNVKVKAASNESNVIFLGASVDMNVDDIVRFQMRVQTIVDGLGTVAFAAETGPPTIPATPSQILTIFSGD